MHRLASARDGLGPCPALRVNKYDHEDTHRKELAMNPKKITNSKRAFETAANLRLQHEVEGGAGGGLVGAIIGAGGGLPGALAGAILGGIAGAMAGAAADTDASRRAARTRELDA
jgi:outer membrane lipoprotein SlyB